MVVDLNVLYKYCEKMSANNCEGCLLNDFCTENMKKGFQHVKDESLRETYRQITEQQWEELWT